MTVIWDLLIAVLIFDGAVVAIAVMVYIVIWVASLFGNEWWR